MFYNKANHSIKTKTIKHKSKLTNNNVKLILTIKQLPFAFEMLRSLSKNAFDLTLSI